MNFDFATLKGYCIYERIRSIPLFFCLFSETILSGVCSLASLWVAYSLTQDHADNSRNEPMSFAEKGILLT